jgi:hypothetical protein
MEINMTIQRIEKTHDRSGKQEIFVQAAYPNAKYGMVQYATWIQTPNCHDMTEAEIRNYMANFEQTAIKNKEDEHQITED